MGQDVTIERYVTPDAISLGLAGLAAGSLAGLAWKLLGRARWGPVPLVIAVLAARSVTDRSDWPGGHPAVLIGVVATAFSAVGAVRLLADPGTHWLWVAGGAVVSAAGVWAGVPETGPAVLAGGVIVGLAGAALATGARWAPAAGVAVAGVLGWAALSGAVDRPWAAIGGTLSLGVAPWLGLGRLLSRPQGGCRPGRCLVGAHLVLTVIAARWIAVVPHPGQARVGLLIACGVAVAVATRRQA